MNDEAFEVVSNEVEIASVTEQLGLLAQPTPRGFTLARKDGWVAVPAESSLHLSEADRFRLQQAFAGSGFRWVYAVAFEKLEHIAPVLRVAASVAGLTAFNRQCAHLDYALCPADMSSIVLCCTTGDFLALAGRPEFVAAAAGKSLADARIAFDEFASDQTWSPKQRIYFSDLLTTLCDEYVSVSVGQSVVFPKD
jgi:hypothetical protein